MNENENVNVNEDVTEVVPVVETERSNKITGVDLGIGIPVAVAAAYGLYEAGKKLVGFLTRKFGKKKEDVIDVQPEELEEAPEEEQ